MAAFQPVVLVWEGKDYTIPADQVLRCIAMIEEVCTLGDLARAQLGKIPVARLSMAFGIALRYAGAQVTDDEVYDGMFTAKGADLMRQVRDKVSMLQQLMIPPGHLQAAAVEGKDAEARRAASSRRPTSSPSA